MIEADGGAGLVVPQAGLGRSPALAAHDSGPTQPGVIQARMDSDRRAAARPFSVIAHRPNYFLLAAWNAEGWDASLYRADTGEAAYSNDDIECQFQVSLKVPLAVGLLDDRMDFYGAYTPTPRSGRFTTASTPSRFAKPTTNPSYGRSSATTGPLGA